MKNPILHIPSVISQSCFTDVDGGVVDIKESEINYFYLLLFLYTEELLKQTPNLLLKNGNRYYLNELIPFESVKIELNEFQQYGVVDNHKYDGVKQFIDNLSELFININLFRKNKDKDVECIKMIESHCWDSTLLTINFTKEFVKELIGVEKFFMEVDLNNLFKLSGGKSKPLYLLLKDYSGSGNKDLSEEELTVLIGKIPQKDRFENIINQINDVTDIKITYEVVGKKKKTYKFKIKNKVNLKSTSKKKKEEINTDIMEKSKKKIQQMKNKGKKFDNEDGYLQTIYKNELEKSKPSKSQTELDELIDRIKKQFEGKFDKNGVKIPTFCFYYSEYSNLPIFINNENKLTDNYDVFTSNSLETLNQINDWIENDEFKYNLYWGDGYSKSLSKVCLLSEEELRSRGMI